MLIGIGNLLQKFKNIKKRSLGEKKIIKGLGGRNRNLICECFFSSQVYNVYFNISMLGRKCIAYWTQKIIVLVLKILFHVSLFCRRINCCRFCRMSHIIHNHDLAHKRRFSPILVGVPSAYIFFYLSFNSKSNYEKGHKPPF